MMTLAEKSGLAGKSILVVGLGKTGLSVVDFLRTAKLSFEIADNRIDVGSLNQIRERLGEAPLHRGFDATLFSSFDVLVCSPGIPRALPEIVAALDAGVEVVGDVELFARLCDAPIIAVTGSNGKSTVVAWIQEVLRGSRHQAVACGNIGEPVLSVLDNSATVYVLELSSFQLESLQSLQPLSATVLNVSEDHMDRYDGLEHYAATKRRIYNGCRCVVVNRDDQRTVPEQIDATASVASFGVAATGANKNTESGHQYQADSVFTTVVQNEQIWLSVNGDAIIPESELPLPGKHNVANALAVLALLSPLSLSVDELAAGLKRFRGLIHRTQLVRTRKDVRWYNDSKGTNIDACVKAVKAMSAPVILIAGGLGKDADFSLLEDVVKAHVKALILIGRDANLIESALSGMTSIYHADSLHSAVQQAAALAEAGDVVLLSPACASFDMFDSFEHRGDVFIREVMELAA